MIDDITALAAALDSLNITDGYYETDEEAAAAILNYLNDAGWYLERWQEPMDDEPEVPSGGPD